MSAYGKSPLFLVELLERRSNSGFWVREAGHEELHVPGTSRLLLIYMVTSREPTCLCVVFESIPLPVTVDDDG